MTIFRFDPDFGKWLADASVVISHLGKTVIDAALTYKKPVVIVPNPEWSLTAGWKDARILAEKVNAVLITKITHTNIYSAIKKAESLKPLSYPDGAEKPAEEILSKFDHNASRALKVTLKS